MAKVYLNNYKSAAAEAEEIETEDEELYCSVLITCKKPAEDGSMQVELSYEGDKVVASYLIHSAQQMFNPD